MQEPEKVIGLGSKPRGTGGRSRNAYKQLKIGRVGEARSQRVGTDTRTSERSSVDRLTERKKELKGRRVTGLLLG